MLLLLISSSDIIYYLYLFIYMEDLESINKLDRVNYYDPEDWEEDKPYKDILISVHKEYEDLEKIYIELSEGISVKSASVYID